jgi:tRNA dimethylallyltransferase
MSSFSNSLILTGPTACGKTTLALDLAERIGAEIVSMDSMTLYRGMDIGTAKPTREERGRVRHHLIDVLDPWESASVAWWLEQAAEVCRDIAGRGKRPLFVGGTPFYLKSLLYGLFPGPPGDAVLRRELEAEAESAGNDVLHGRLAAVDPKTAARLHPNDVRRVVRALEVFRLTGKPISAWQQSWDTPAFATSPAATPLPAHIPAVVLELPREILYERINRRVDAMFAAGWLDEVRRLQVLSKPLSREARQALGYRELLNHLDETELSWEHTVELIRTHTRQFAKRQLTWFRHLHTCVRVPADATNAVDLVLQWWAKSSANGEIDTPA